MAGLTDPKLHKPGGPFLVSEVCNHKGFAVMRMVVFHDNVGADALELLNHSEDVMVLTDVIENLKTPEEVVERFRDRAKNDSQLQDALAARANQQQKLRQEWDADKQKLSGVQASPGVVDPDADFIKWVAKLKKVAAASPRQTGCSSGPRAALLDLEQFPKVAACSAHWTNGSIRAKKTGALCGGRVSCDIPANACASGWHLCGAGPKVASELSLGLSAEQCAGLTEGRFVAAVSNADCGSCATSGGPSAVCCGRGCAQQDGHCIMPQGTVRAGALIDTKNPCGAVDMPEGGNKNGVLCCLDANGSFAEAVDSKRDGTAKSR